MKIVIVGGGTAGWLAALYIARFNVNNKNEIVVIESSKIPIIGAGEGSTGVLPRVIKNNFANIGINEIDFLYNTEATLKLGINLKDWDGIGTQFYSPVQPSETTMQNVDFDFVASLYNGNYVDSSQSGYLMSKGLSGYFQNKRNVTSGYSYHFDAHKVGQYLKSYALKMGVKVLDTEINSLNINSETGELDSVETTIGNMTSDFWIDCSGFSRVLINPMGGGWVSYKEYLPVNGAIPYLHNYKTDEDVKMETLSWAMPNGWMWQIPTQTRYGCGYVYSDMFTTYDKAVDELMKTTGRKIEPLRNIKFDVGRCENIWVKNVCAIGLAAGFVEPLEATSIHATIIQLDLLLSNNLNFMVDKKDILYNANIKSYNNYFGKLFDDVKDLIQIHYITKREDTDFWKFCKYELKRTDKVKDILELCKHKSPSIQDFDMYHGASSWGVWCWTLAGLGHITKDTIKNTLNGYNHSKESIKEAVDEIDYRNRMNSVKTMTTKDFMRTLLKKRL
jgi:flavin-dependent dehydrogenase